MFFELFPSADVDIISRTGENKFSTKAHFGKKGKVTLPDPSLVIDIGDEIRRVLPSGQEETFEIIEYSYKEAFHGIPAHYDIDIKRKGQFPRGSGGNYSLSVHGNNARINFQSHDQSTNVINEREVFTELAKAVGASDAATAQKEAMLQAVEMMKAARTDRSGLLSGYQKLISVAAEHITVIAPFLPALGQLVSGG